MMPPFRRTLIAVAVVMTGCATIPDTDPAIENARAALESAHNDPQVVALAPLELRQADDAFQVAVAAWRNYGSRIEIDHLAYLAFQRAQIAREAARLKSAEASVTTAVAERDRVRLEARTREAELARRQAEAAQMQAEETRRQALAAQRQAQIAQDQAEQSRAQALEAQQQAVEADARSRTLEIQLVDLQARNTDRGIVITLGDVLFETGSARLNPGGVRAVDRLADFLERYPRRRVAIEGYTDSVGGDTYNQDLSERRANAVRVALLDVGVGVERMTARGFGKSYPIADNASATGRQLNRRVEILVSDESGRLTPRTS
jgi:outer membrane protein OmpA-like peptidoglycan-associated protein